MSAQCRVCLQEIMTGLACVERVVFPLQMVTEKKLFLTFCRGGKGASANPAYPLSTTFSETSQSASQPPRRDLHALAKELDLLFFLFSREVPPRGLMALLCVTGKPQKLRGGCAGSGIIVHVLNWHGGITCAN